MLALRLRCAGCFVLTGWWSVTEVNFGAALTETFGAGRDEEVGAGLKSLVGCFRGMVISFEGRLLSMLSVLSGVVGSRGKGVDCRFETGTGTGTVCDTVGKEASGLDGVLVEAEGEMEAIAGRDR